MDLIHWDNDDPGLRSPITVAAFSGWNDAASSASASLEAVAAALDSEIIGRLDPESFYDFQANRPVIAVSDGRVQGVEWPSNTLVAARAPSSDRDLLLISGTEPSTHWRTYCSALVEAAESLGSDTLVTLGALIADVPHTRPVPITGVATSEEMIERLGVGHVEYHGPTGVTGIIHAICAERGWQAAGLWAAVPHYAAGIPNPKAALALLRRLEGIVGIALDAAALEEATERFETQVDRAVTANPQIKELVERLEEQQADADLDPTTEIPSGDAIARELQDFLRQVDDE